MTENKRFTIKEIDNFDYGIKVTDVIIDDGIELPQSTVCDLLNELNNENKQLRNDCSILVQSNQNYRKEKEQLKQKIKFINEILSEDIGYIESLRKIEEALK